MRCTRSALIVVFGLPLLVQGARPAALDPKRGLLLGQSSPSSTPTTTIIATVVPLSSSRTSSVAKATTTIQTIKVTSFFASPSPSSNSSPNQNSSVDNGYQSTSQGSSMPMSSTSPVTSSNNDSHQTLVIVLSTVLGFVRLVLIASGLFLCRRYRRSQTPFGHRGASPINDDEIASWRKNAQDRKQQVQQVPQIPQQCHGPLNIVSSIPLKHSPGWTWAASPSSISIHTVQSPTTPFHPSPTPPIISPTYTLPDTPSFLARAPNSRAGLTDETVPGADPFITPPKRQSSRLSKAPPGHARSKSRRSSMSAKSIWSINTNHNRASSDAKVKEISSPWYEQADESMGDLSGHARTTRTSSSPRTSIFDGLSQGGLSPRPRSRSRHWPKEEDIGRAIA